MVKMDWIEIDQFSKIPDFVFDCYICVDWNVVEKGYFDSFVGQFFSEDSQKWYCPEDLTHYMMLGYPEPPKKKEFKLEH